LIPCPARVSPLAKFHLDNCRNEDNANSDGKINYPKV
jgi:hypothetical protein